MLLLCVGRTFFSLISISFWRKLIIIVYDVRSSFFAQILRILWTNFVLKQCFAVFLISHRFEVIFFRSKKSQFEYTFLNSFYFISFFKQYKFSFIYHRNLNNSIEPKLTSKVDLMCNSNSFFCCCCFKSYLSSSWMRCTYEMHKYGCFFYLLLTRRKI